MSPADVAPTVLTVLAVPADPCDHGMRPGPSRVVATIARPQVDADASDPDDEIRGRTAPRSGSRASQATITWTKGRGRSNGSEPGLLPGMPDPVRAPGAWDTAQVPDDRCACARRPRATPPVPVGAGVERRVDVVAVSGHHRQVAERSGPADLDRADQLEVDRIDEGQRGRACRACSPPACARTASA